MPLTSRCLGHAGEQRSADRRCWGRTKNLRRCARRGAWRHFCPEHANQPYLLAIFICFTVLGGAASLASFVQSLIGHHVSATYTPDARRSNSAPSPIPASRSIDGFVPGIRVTLSHLTAEFPRKFLLRNGLLKVSLEENGPMLSVCDKSVTKWCNTGMSDESRYHVSVRVVQSYGTRRTIILVGVFVPGYRFIYHDIDVDAAKCFFTNEVIHIELYFKSPFEIRVPVQGFELLFPRLPWKNDGGSLDAMVPVSGLSGCPMFIILNKTSSHRYTLCKPTKTKGHTRFFYTK